MTYLHSGIYLDGKDASGSWRLDRVMKFADYYRSIQKELGFQYFYFVDNGSSNENLNTLLEANTDIMLVSLPHLPTGRDLDYPYCWRALYYIRDIMSDGSKVLSIDSDMFVLSKRLANHIRDLNSGWTAFWCPKYAFPESSLTVLCSDALPIFTEFCKGDFTRHNGKFMERTCTYTHVEKSFIGDRYGENKTVQTPEMDYYGQCPVNIELRFTAHL